MTYSKTNAVLEAHFQICFCNYLNQLCFDNKNRAQ